MLPSIQPQSNASVFSAIFGDENERNGSEIDLANVTVDIDQTNKQILVDVSTSLSQNAHQSQKQSLNASKSQCELDEIKDDTFMIGNNTRLARSLNNTTVESPEVDNNCYKSSEVIIDDSITMYTTPIAQRLSYERERTPIGKIRLRKITPKTATPEIPDEETYEVVMVTTSTNAQISREHFDSMEMMREFDEISPAINYPVMPMNAAIASKASEIAHLFPLSPRIILHRIDSIDEYMQTTSQQPTRKVIAAKNKTKQTKKGT